MTSEKKNKLVRLGLMTLAALVLGGALYRFNAQKILGNQLPMPFGVGMSVVLSSSMEPTLSKNDLVVIRKNSDTKIGDIAVYQDGSMLVIHRIVDEVDDTWIFRGDANSGVDAPVHKSQVKGTLAFAIPGAGAVVAFLQKPWMTLLVLAGALALGERSFRKEKASDKRELEQLRAQIQELKEASQGGDRSEKQ